MTHGSLGRLSYAGGSDPGRTRSVNQDSAYASPRLLAVADGMGGHAHGEIACSVVVAAIRELDTRLHGLRPGHSDLLRVLAEGVTDAFARLTAIGEARPDTAGMGTTLTALLWDGSRLGVAHIGDSRAYLLSGGVLRRITRDHTLVQSLIDAGQLTQAQAEEHPRRTMVVRALQSGGPEPEPDLFFQEVSAGDRLLVCSDGLTAVVSDRVIAETMSSSIDPRQAVARLIDLANRGGGPDNITCLVADVVPVDADPGVGGGVAGGGGGAVTGWEARPDVGSGVGSAGGSWGDSGVGGGAGSGVGGVGSWGGSGVGKADVGGVAGTAGVGAEAEAEVALRTGGDVPAEPGSLVLGAAASRLDTAEFPALGARAAGAATDVATGGSGAGGFGTGGGGAGGGGADGNGDSSAVVPLRRVNLPGRAGESGGRIDVGSAVFGSVDGFSTAEVPAAEVPATEVIAAELSAADVTATRVPAGSAAAGYEAGAGGPRPALGPDTGCESGSDSHPASGSAGAGSGWSAVPAESDGSRLRTVGHRDLGFGTGDAACESSGAGLRPDGSPPPGAGPDGRGPDRPGPGDSGPRDSGPGGQASVENTGEERTRSRRLPRWIRRFLGD
ncbi:PP2C family protein-serine/threonine phosphatase [Actinoalloteichus sp. GBA129-24]|uniref:PP2C family protein-serine/threonine phosphatase n=1 Tax=Actinoalloteichus sp. GBA129-24 TaxID=1612551 RepID=UPI0009503EC9|nr:protein phosphatase 2C domain-containing protein [Actinoalloteichus sp. GBA129-24]APU18583.1 serine/threonine protein phosphatase [Actinoalloteichus sp. GBA129-24]